VRREIRRTAIGFSLDDPADAARPAIVVHEVHPNEIARDLKSGTRVKVAG
jgi:hypothetical protein